MSRPPDQTAKQVVRDALSLSRVLTRAERNTSREQYQNVKLCAALREALGILLPVLELVAPGDVDMRQLELRKAGERAGVWKPRKRKKKTKPRTHKKAA